MVRFPSSLRRSLEIGPVWLLTVTLLLVASNTSAAQWTLHLSGVDDSAVVLINNSKIGECTFGQTCDIELNRYLRHGLNLFELRVNNTSAGWTFAYRLLKDGDVMLAAQCGKFNVFGCMGDQQDTGIVYDVRVNIAYYEAASPDARASPRTAQELNREQCSWVEYFALSGDARAMERFNEHPECNNGKQFPQFMIDMAH